MTWRRIKTAKSCISWKFSQTFHVLQDNVYILPGVSIMNWEADGSSVRNLRQQFVCWTKPFRMWFCTLPSFALPIVALATVPCSTLIDSLSQIDLCKEIWAFGHNETHGSHGLSPKMEWKVWVNTFFVGCLVIWIGLPLRVGMDYFLSLRIAYAVTEPTIGSVRSIRLYAHLHLWRKRVLYTQDV